MSPLAARQAGKERPGFFLGGVGLTRGLNGGGRGVLPNGKDTQKILKSQSGLLAGRRGDSWPEFRPSAGGRSCLLSLHRRLASGRSSNLYSSDTGTLEHPEGGLSWSMDKLFFFSPLYVYILCPGGKTSPAFRL